MIAKNAKKAFQSVKHSHLVPINEYNVHASRCPKCWQGFLFLHRHPVDLTLLPIDRCSACGQRFVYEDIEEMRLQDSWA